MDRMDRQAEVVRRFETTLIKDDQADAIGIVRAMYKSVAMSLDAAKDGRAKSLALTKLEESCMWAVKAISHDGLAEITPPRNVEDDGS